MKKRILAAGILMLMFIVTACGNDELVETPVITDISVDENGNPSLFYIQFLFFFF